jgi:hypothetical protein
VDGAVGQMALVAAALLAGMVLAWALFTILGRADRTARREINRARGADRPEWAPGIWHCAACLSTNPPTADRCARCREPRRELVHAPAEVRPDWIPERIEVPSGAVVTLIHDPSAHFDPSEAHWQVRVGGRMEGSAAARAGALALLRALDGVDIVYLDVRGTGTSQYRLTDVIARFEGQRFPLDVPCPEAAG